MKSIKYISRIFFLLAAVGTGGFLWHHFTTNKTIDQLLSENKELRTAITNLSQEEKIGYAKILSQETR
ncbi:MAG: hypothetical protein ACYSO1_08890, partial [Planctomycetota bacterium]